VIDFDDFMKVDIRVGRVVRVEDFPEAQASVEAVCGLRA
jgi:tRNA-binding EMAP/Myf-like protein